ncbi:MAG TPA: single-stranded DNA-binding protein [Jiangellaceae bacterium]
MSNPHEHRNEVHLVGRVTRDPVVHRLPSGDTVVSLWLVVKRPPLTLIRRGRQSVDTLELVARTSSVKDVVAEWRPNDVVAASGALRHRFWQGNGGLRSKYEVELADVVLLHRPDPYGEPAAESG